MPWYTASGANAVRQYGDRRDMERDMAKAAEHGWEVVATMPYTRRPLWRLIIPIWWLFGTSGFPVTYRHN